MNGYIQLSLFGYDDSNIGKTFVRDDGLQIQIVSRYYPVKAKTRRRYKMFPGEDIWYTALVWNTDGWKEYLLKVNAWELNRLYEEKQDKHQELIERWKRVSLEMQGR